MNSLVNAHFRERVLRDTTSVAIIITKANTSTCTSVDIIIDFALYVVFAPKSTTYLGVHTDSNFYILVDIITIL